MNQVLKRRLGMGLDDLTRGVSSFHIEWLKNLPRVLLYVKHFTNCKHWYSSYWICLMVMTGFRNEGREEAF